MQRKRSARFEHRVAVVSILLRQVHGVMIVNPPVFHAIRIRRDPKHESLLSCLLPLLWMLRLLLSLRVSAACPLDMVTCCLLLRADLLNRSPRPPPRLGTRSNHFLHSCSRLTRETMLRNHCFAECLRSQVCFVFFTPDSAHSQPLRSDLILYPQVPSAKK